MKLTIEDFNGIYILSMFISGIILAILGTILYKSDLMKYIGIGLLSVSMAISLFEMLMRKNSTR